MSTSTRGRTPVNDQQFPQADNLSRILDVLATSCSGPKVDEVELGRVLGITPRQGYYYANAAGWVGLTLKFGGWIRPTGAGQRLNALGDEGDRIRGLADMVLAKPVFSEVARHVAAFGAAPSVGDVADWVRAEDGKVNDETAGRRAQTVLSWIGRIQAEAPEAIEALAPAAAARVA